MTTFTSPRKNPNDDDLLTGLFNIFEKYIQKTIEKCLPVKVIAISEDGKYVDVQPQILVVLSDKKNKPRPVVKGIPIFTYGAGNFFMSFKIEVGDTGWIISNDRDISTFLQTKQLEPPPTARFHDFSNGFFLPDVIDDYTIDPADRDSLVIQNKEGTVKLTLNDNQITIVAPTVVINDVDFSTHTHGAGDYMDAEGRALSGDSGPPE